MSPARPCSSSCATTLRSPKVVYRWLAEDEAPVGIPPTRIDGLHNTDGDIRTIRVDSKVVRESDDGGAKSDADRWMRLTLDTVGKTDWPWDTQRRPIYPDGFEALAKKLERPPSSAGTGRALHRERRDADRGLGLQHRHPHRRAPPVHVPASLRAGGRAGAAPLQLCGGGRRKARGGSGEDLRGPVRDRAAEGEPGGQRVTPAPEGLADPRASGEGRTRDPVPPSRALHATDSASLEGRLGQHRSALP